MLNPNRRLALTAASAAPPPPPPPPPPRLRGCKTALRLTALALLLATLAVAAGGLLGAPRAGEAAFAPQTTTDYDTDDDGLIDITTLAQLDAIRYDLDGNGIIADADDAAAYLRAFPGRKTDAPNPNGCDGDGDGTPANVCIGYELMNDLDFDENGDGLITAAGDPTYWDDGKGWMPIGQPVISGAASQNAAFGLVAYYTAIFEGNEHSISNLHINRAIDGDQNLTYVALFAAVSGRIRNVDLRNPQVAFRRAGTIGQDAPPAGAPPGTPPEEKRSNYVGGLAGSLGSGGRIDDSRIVGGGVTFTQGAGRHSSTYVGCLAGRGFQGAISGSSASCAVNIYAPQRGGVGGTTQFGGDGIPRDTNTTWSGGLVGNSFGAHITASYAAGDVSCHQDGNQFCGGLVGEAVIANIVSSYATGNVVNRLAITAYSSHDRLTGGPSGEVQACHTWNGTPYSTGALLGRIAGGGITDSYATGRVTVPEGVRAERCPAIKAGGLVGNSQAALGSVNPGSITNSYWDRETTTYDYIGSGRSDGPTSGISMVGAHTTAELQMPTTYGATNSARYFEWNRDVDNDVNTGDASGNDDPWDFGGAGDYPALKYGRLDVGPQRLLAHAGARQQVYSGSRVTLDGSGSGVLKGSGSGVLRSGATVTHAWTQTGANAAAHRVDLAGANTARPTFTAPTGLTEDTTLEFTLTVGKTGQTYTATGKVYVDIQAVLPNQLLSLSLADPEGDAVGLAPSFVSSEYNYRASVANQIASVTLTPAALDNSTLTVNGAAVSSGAAVEVPLKYRGNEIAIVVTPPGLDDGADGDGNGDGDEEQTPCSEENVGGKPCTYTINVRRAVPPRLAFVPRSLTIDEGGTGAYTVELDTRILTGAVTIAIASDNPTVTVSPTEVTLKPLDMAPRTITVTAAADDDRDDENVVITHTANGAHYYDVIATVGVTVNDTTPEPALSVSAAMLELVEGGQGSYTVALASAPDGAVAVSIASDNPEVTAAPAELAFTPDDWDTAQWVRVSAAADNDAAADTATLTHTASGGGYDAAPAAQVRVSVTDDDRAGLVIAPDELAITENGSGVFRVTLGTQPTANVTVSIASDNPDVSARPAALVFTPANWDTGQAVTVSARVDQGSGDELATVRLTAQGGGYNGLRGNVLVSVDDRLVPVITTTRPGAPAGVGVYGPAGSAARATVAAAGADTPTMATGAGFGIGTAVGIAVTRGPAGGLEVCLPVSDALRTDADAAALTLLRYAGGAWAELAGARDLGDRVCAGGVTGEASYAAGYALRPGTVLDLAASVGADPGTIELSWTPPAAGMSQVAVVVNAADDTDYCLDTLAGLDASSYTCAGRTAGQTYVALLIVLLPDGGYTLANIVRFELPAAGGQ